MKSSIAPVLLSIVLSPAPAVAQKVYGGRIEPREVSKAVEDCEYRLLVEEQVCNTRLNKSDCIEETRKYCLEHFSGSNAPHAPSDVISPEQRRPER